MALAWLHVQRRHFADSLHDIGSGSSTSEEGERGMEQGETVRWEKRSRTCSCSRQPFSESPSRDTNTAAYSKTGMGPSATGRHRRRQEGAQCLPERADRAGAGGRAHAHHKAQHCVHAESLQKTCQKHKDRAGGRCQGRGQSARGGLLGREGGGGHSPLSLVLAPPSGPPFTPCQSAKRSLNSAVSDRSFKTRMRVEAGRDFARIACRRMSMPLDSP